MPGTGYWPLSAVLIICEYEWLPLETTAFLISGVIRSLSPGAVDTGTNLRAVESSGQMKTPTMLGAPSF